ncbi:MAG: cyclophane-forming radical SAM peptide maturase AmcB [Stackebrandtia sp.]
MNPHANIQDPSTVVMQPTTLCNLDCRYCYLPFRRDNHVMPAAVAEAVAEGVAEWSTDREVEILWHGGEPLAVGRVRLAALMSAFDGLNVVHSVQTNATLIDDGWCEFIARTGMRVGVSIDGPASDNAQRTNLAGRPAFSAIMRGIEMLRAHDIPFSVIAVVSDPDPARADAWYEWFAALGGTSLGVNIEECEGVNTRDSRTDTDRTARFWAALIYAWHANPTIRVREIDHVRGYSCAVLHNQPMSPPPIDPLPTVAYDGAVTVISPELAGFDSPRHGPFTCGNVLDAPLPALVDAGMRAPWVTEFLTGVDNCRATCPYFELCGGAHPANKHFEHAGRLDGTQTAYCRNSKIALMEGALHHAEHHHNIVA